MKSFFSLLYFQATVSRCPMFFHLLHTLVFYAWRSTPSLGEQHDEEGEDFFLLRMASELLLSSFPLPGRVHMYRKMLFSASFVLYCLPIMRFLQEGEHTVSSNSCLQGNLTYPTTVCNLNLRPFLPCTRCLSRYILATALGRKFSLSRQRGKREERKLRRSIEGPFKPFHDNDKEAGIEGERGRGESSYVERWNGDRREEALADADLSILQSLPILSILFLTVREGGGDSEEAQFPEVVSLSPLPHPPRAFEPSRPPLLAFPLSGLKL